jgi:hypothetical protein
MSFVLGVDERAWSRVILVMARWSGFSVHIMLSCKSGGASRVQGLFGQIVGQHPMKHRWRIHKIFLAVLVNAAKHLLHTK